MIRGSVERGRPFIEAFVLLPQFLLGDRVPFLVDTGADTSLIHPADAQNLGIDYSRDLGAAPVVTTTGVGGVGREYRVVCDVLLRHEEGHADHLPIEFGFAVPAEWNQGYVSVLGRDILRHYRLTFEEMSGLVLLETPSSFELAPHPHRP